MRVKRHSELQRLQKRAYEALERGEWWDGQRWHARDDAGTLAKAAGYKTALEVIGETAQAMVGNAPVGSDDGVQAANRFEQSAKALRGKKTKREGASITAWDSLVKAYGKETMLNDPLTQEFLSACADTLEAANVPPPRGGDGWYSERMFRVRDLIKRHRARLQPSL